MPSNYFGRRLSLITPPVAPTAATLTLVITSGAVTLINGGMTAVTVTDGTNPVTGCTLIISDGTKASASGQNVTGTAESGTYTVTATKASYTNSSPVTFTCSGGCLILDPNSGTNTIINLGAVTTWNDSAGNMFVGTGTYKTGGVNGQNAVTFNGTTDAFASPSLTSYNNGTFYEFMCLVPTSSSASNRNLTSLNVSSTSGYTTSIDTSNLQRMSTFDGSAHNTTNATLSLSTPYYLTSAENIANSQILIANNTTTNTSGSGYTANGSALTHRVGANSTGLGNFTAMDLYLRLYVNRYPTATERAQIQLRGKTLLGL